MRRRWLRHLPVALVVVALGCAPQPQSRSREVADSEVPFGLLDPDEPTTTTSVLADPSVPFTVYVVGGDDVLVAIERRTDELDVMAVVDGLTAPLSAEELDQGLRSLLSRDGGDPLVTGTGLNGGVAAVDLDVSFAELDGGSQVLAIGQLVLSLTALPGVGQVAFTVEGVPVEVPRADGTTSADPLVREDYIGVLGP